MSTDPSQTPSAGAPTIAAPQTPDETAASRPAYLDASDAERVNKTGYSDPGLPSCPNCKTGVMYVTRWDPNATHEIGQSIWHPQELSGGSVAASCFNCGYAESVPMNPQPAPPNPNPGA